MNTPLHAPDLVIAMLMNPHGTTGVQTHVQQFAAHLRAQQRPGVLATPFDAPLALVASLIGLRRVLERRHPEAAVRLYRHGHAWLLGRALRRRLSTGQDCIVYCQCPVSAEVALRVRSTPRQRVVLVTHFNGSQADEWAGKGLIAPDGPLHRQISTFEQDLLPRLDAVVYVSAHVQRQLQARIPALASVPAAVIPNFIADPLATPRPAVDVSDPPVRDLLCIGTLEPRKNQRHVLRTLAALKARGLVLTVTFAGDGPDRAALAEAARQLGIDAQVHLAGHVPQASTLFAHHRACIHAARAETQGLCLIEAMAWGRPVFAAPVDGVPEVLQDDVQGRYLPLHDPHAAADILADAWRDGPRWQRWATAARDRYTGHYRRDDVAARLERFLRHPPQVDPVDTGAAHRSNRSAWT